MIWDAKIHEVGAQIRIEIEIETCNELGIDVNGSGSGSERGSERGSETLRVCGLSSEHWKF